MKSKIRDPLGIILQFVVRSEILLKNLWRIGITWDEQLKDSDSIHWKGWVRNFNQMENHRIPRAFLRNYG